MATDAEPEIISPLRTVDFPAEWYECTTDDHFWFEWRFRSALRQISAVGLPTGRPLRVLDVGGGTGLLRSQIEARTAWVADLADLNLTALRSARKGRGRTMYYDVLKPAPDLLEAYDVVLLFDVLEHIEARPAFTDAVLRHLVPGGSLLVNVPALQRFFGAFDEAAGHLLRYDRSTLRREFKPTGLEILDVRYWGLSLVPLLALRKVLLRGRRRSEGTIRTGLKPPGRLAHAALRSLMLAESQLPRVPIGASLLLAGRKP